MRRGAEQRRASLLEGHEVARFVVGGAVVARVVRRVSGREAKRLRHALARADFWGLPQRPSDGLHDGAWWIVEGAVEDRYHVVNRWSPRPGAYRDLGLCFIELSQLDLPEREIY